MDTFKDEAEFTHFHMQRVLDMFDGRPSFQQIVRLGILANMGYGNDQDDLHEDAYDYDDCIHGHAVSHGYPRMPDRNSDRGLSESRSRSSGSLNQPPLRQYASAHDLLPPSANAQTKESSAERKAGLLVESKKSKGKAEKKRLKKQKQKERKRLEKQEKEKQNPLKNEEEGDDAQQSKAEESKPVNKSENNTSSSVKQSAPAKDTDSSDSSGDESSEDGDNKNDSLDSEELDMASSFVSKAALIARRQLQQKPGNERKERKKTPDKEKHKVLSKPKEDLEAGKKDSAASSSLTLEDNIKISTDLANTGNKFASEGDFNMAVKYFTDAIRYNPTEFKLFGNRSFCFEKMQEYTKALADAEVSLSMCPGWVKGLFRKGRALAGLKRYQEAAQAFREVLKADSSCAEAAQELMRVQITQLMGYGYTREQSSNALIIHGTVNKALEVLSDLNRPGATKNGTLSPPQVANISGVSPVLSASTGPAPPRPPPHQSHNAPKPPPFKYRPLGPVQNMSNGQSRPKLPPDQAMKTKNEDYRPSQELFPVWVGNLIYPVNETTLTNLFNKVGLVYSVKVLSMKRCAFVNFTKQEHCDEAIRRFHGFELSGVKLAVRYPDRIPPGMGISRSALKANDLHDENVRQNGTSDWAEASGNRGPVRHYKQGPNVRGNDKN